MTGKTLSAIIMGIFLYGMLIRMLWTGEMSYHLRRNRPGKLFVGAFDYETKTTRRDENPVEFWIYWVLGLIVSTVMVGFIYIS